MGNRQGKKGHSFGNKSKSKIKTSCEVQTEPIKVWIPNLRDCLNVSLIDQGVTSISQENLKEIRNVSGKLERNLSMKMACGDTPSRSQSKQSTRRYLDEDNIGELERLEGIRCGSRVRNQGDVASLSYCERFEDNRVHQDCVDREKGMISTSPSVCEDTSSAELEEFLAAENWCRDPDDDSHRSDDFSDAINSVKLLSDEDNLEPNNSSTLLPQRQEDINERKHTLNRSFPENHEIKKSATWTNRKPMFEFASNSPREEFIYKQSPRRFVPLRSHHPATELRRPGVCEHPKWSNIIEYTFYIDDNDHSMKPFYDRRISSLINIDGCNVSLLGHEFAKKRQYFKGMPVRPVVVRAPTMMALRRCLGRIDTQFPQYHAKAFLMDTS